jgi:hypothetical protein
MNATDLDRLLRDVEDLRRAVRRNNPFLREVISSRHLHDCCQQRPEYFATGWYAFAASLTSIFFLERAPFLWTAAVWDGLSFVFGLVGLLGNSRRRGAGSPPGRIPPGRGRDGT